MASVPSAPRKKKRSKRNDPHCPSSAEPMVWRNQRPSAVQKRRVSDTGRVGEKRKVKTRRTSPGRTASGASQRRRTIAGRAKTRRFSAPERPTIQRMIPSGAYRPKRRSRRARSLSTGSLLTSARDGSHGEVHRAARAGAADAGHRRAHRHDALDGGSGRAALGPGGVAQGRRRGGGGGFLPPEIPPGARPP